MAKVLRTLSRKWKEQTTYWRTRDELSKLSNRDLADLGIARNDIEFIAREHSKNSRQILSGRSVNVAL